MSGKQPNIFAAIHLGSEKLSINIVEYRSLNSIKILSSAERRVRIGEETFKTDQISAVTIRELCEMLNSFNRMMKEYGVTKHILVGTTAMREARNRAFMLEQIYMATGLYVEVVDMPQEIYYKYVSIAKTLKENNIGVDGSSTLFADISSGGLGITLVENSVIKFQQNMHIGVLRVKESFDINQRASSSFNGAISEYLDSIVSPVHDRLKGFNIKRIVVTGTNTSLLLNMLDLPKSQNKIVTVKTQKFENLYNRVIDMKLAKIMEEFDLTENVAELVLPTIIFYQQLITLASIPEIIFPPNSFIDALVLLHVAKEKEHPWLEELREELITFVYNIAKYYRYDNAHAKQVTKFAQIIFERTAKIHGLGTRERLMLSVAAILHDIGKCINLRQHYRYSASLILSSDIFGFSDAEKKIIAASVYQHARNILTFDNNSISVLDRQEVSLVAKLAAILRVADALDRSYKQKIKDLKISFKGGKLHFIVTANQDISLERWTFEDKTEFFMEVFGIKPVLIEKTN